MILGFVAMDTTKCYSDKLVGDDGVLSMLLLGTEEEGDWLPSACY